jgi:AcrR family transcriptional regulator
MSREASQKRKYDSPRRREQAAATRNQILEAAHPLFVERGYAATSMAAIAKAAGVAPKTVYVVFETKAALLRALWHRVLRGENDEIPAGEQPWFREVVEEKDPEKMLRLNARNSRVAKTRMAGIGNVILAAAPSDPQIGQLWSNIQSQFLENQRVIVDGLAKRKALKKGLTPAKAADIMWTLNHPNVYHLLVGVRGWSPESYEKWLGDAFVSELLP